MSDLGFIQRDALLPPSATRLERDLEGAGARLADVSADPAALWDPQTCPAVALPFLAWAFSVDHWRADWPEATKRAVLAAAASVHRQKGTVYAVRRALQALNARVDLREWFDTGGAPYTATARIFAFSPNGAPQLSAELLADLEASLRGAGNARSHIALIFGVVFSPGPAAVAHDVGRIDLMRLRMAQRREALCGRAAIGELRPLSLLRLSLTRRPLTQPLPEQEP